MPDMSDRLFFVIGAPRSGTTLLMRMLNMHPDIYTRPEPHLMTPLAHLGYYAYPEKAAFDPFQSHQGVRNFVADLPNGEEDYLDALRAYSDTLYGRMLEPTGRRYFLDKTPAYALVLPFLKKLYPNAVFVVLTRHPFAIFSSYAKSFFDDDWPAAEAFNPVVQRYVPAIAEFLADPPERFHHVQYEDLVADPEKHLRAICAAADIPYTDDLIEYGDKEVEGEGLGDPIGVSKHKRPTTASVHKWARNVAGNDERIAQLTAMVQRLDDADLERFGTPRDALFTPLEDVSAEAAHKAQSQAKKWDRYAVERRALLVLRRNIHDNALGRTLKKVRFYCDVLLRE
ncbi:MAG: sulfotransferase [Deltaproteobacteria bacterium]|nr:MAG: sulfotransferase [Deltaproteobacteria bacterium]